MGDTEQEKQTAKSSILIDRELLKRAKILAAASGQTIRGMTEKSLSDYLDKLEKKTTTTK
jgi:predicted transcriptional regulator